MASASPGSTDIEDGLDETDWSVAQDVLPRVPVGWARGIVTGPAEEGVLTVALADGTDTEIVLDEQHLSANAIVSAVEPGSIVAMSPVEITPVEADPTLDSEAETVDAADKATTETEEDELALADAPLQWRLESLPSRQVAVVIMEADTGNIRGLIGGYDPGLSEFDRSNAIRQPGSSIKPLLWLAALEAGLEYDQMVLDLPIEVQTADGRWQPANYGGDFVGTVPLFTALERSINLVAARLAYEIGVETFASMAERAGAYPTGEMELVLSAALGSVGTTPVAMAGAYATIANDGVPVRPTLVHSIHDPLTDRDVWQATPGWGLPFDSRAADNRGGIDRSSAIDDAWRHHARYRCPVPLPALATRWRARRERARISATPGSSVLRQRWWSRSGSAAMTTSRWGAAMPVACWPPR